MSQPAPELDFQQIHAEFRPRIQRYLAGLVGEFEAEDLTQEVFVRVSRGLGSFRGESKLSTWIYRIATHAAFDKMREPSFRRAAQAEPAEDAAAGEGEGREVWTGESPPSLEEQVHHAERLDCYCEQLQSLPENYRLVVALNQLEDFTAKEIAEILGLSVDVVKLRLHRGKARLLAELKARCYPEDWL